MENPQQPGRRAFLSQTGKLTTACAVIGLTGGMAQAASPGGEPCAPTPMTLTDRHYCLSEVRLEDGFEYDGETVIGTRTALYTLEIKDGKIAAIHAANAALPAGVPAIRRRAGCCCRHFAICTSTWIKPSTAARGRRRARARAKPSWT